MTKKPSKNLNILVIIGAILLCISLIYISLSLVAGPPPAYAPGLSPSDKYWRGGGAKPFAILEHSCTSNDSSSTLSLVIQSKVPDELFLKEVRVEPGNGLLKTSEDKEYYSPGQKKRFDISLNKPCPSGQNYSYHLSFVYTQNGSVIEQIGEKTLDGKCS